MRVAFLGGSDWVVAFLVPDLAADFHVDVAAVAGLVDEAEEFAIIDLAAFAGQHEAGLALAHNCIFHMDKARVRHHELNCFFQ